MSASGRLEIELEGSWVALIDLPRWVINRLDKIDESTIEKIISTIERRQRTAHEIHLLRATLCLKGATEKASSLRDVTASVREAHGHWMKGGYTDEGAKVKTLLAQRYAVLADEFAGGLFARFESEAEQKKTPRGKKGCWQRAFEEFDKFANGPDFVPVNEVFGAINVWRLLADRRHSDFW